MKILSFVPYRICLIIPLRCPGGLFGPSCMAVSELAKEELNASAGIGGRPVEFFYVDGGAPVDEVVAEVLQLAQAGEIDAITGWHISSIRKKLGPLLKGKIPYVYTSLFEGDETTTGIYCSGENPEQQVYPALSWLRENFGCRRWHVVGARYEWPVRSVNKLAAMASGLGIEIVGTSFVPMGHGNSPQLVEAVAHSNPDGVLMFLVGQDAVAFNRNFAAAGLSEKIIRYSSLMEENMLLGSGAEATKNLYSSAAYFRSLVSAEALDFIGRYTRSAGRVAPALNNMAQSCYQGIYTLAALVKRSGGFSVEAFNAVVDGLSFTGPRGTVRFEGNQAVSPITLARAEQLDFHVIDTL